MSKKNKKIIKNVVNMSKDLYTMVEALMMQAIVDNASVKGIYQVPFSVLMNQKVNKFPGVNLTVHIEVHWDGEIDANQFNAGPKDS